MKFLCLPVLYKSSHSVLKAVVAILCLSFFTDGAWAQSTAGIQGPNVKKGTTTFGYRFVAIPPDDGDEERFAHRFDFTRAFTDNFSARGILNFNNSDTGDLELTFSRIEGVYQFLEKEKAGFDSAIRLELQVADGDDRPSDITLSWASEFDLGGPFRFRSFVLAGRQFGDQRTPGLIFEFRTRTTYLWKPALNFNIESFHVLQPTSNPGSFSDTNLVIGPTISGKLGYGGLSYNTGALIGATSAASDLSFRFFLTKAF